MLDRSHLADQPGHVVAKYLAETGPKMLFCLASLTTPKADSASITVSLILRDPEGRRDNTAISPILSRFNCPCGSQRQLSSSTKASVNNIPWQVKALQRELVAPNGQVVALTRNEVKVCLALANSSNEPTNREALTLALYGRFDSSANRALDAVIKRLRQKIVANVSAVDPITTHYGEGHRFTAPIIAVNQ